jgi:choline dehydrogenase-like flavoprotein
VVRVATLAGGRFDVSARLFVLAAGGIENPRLLLLSDRDRPSALGNGHGLVGRYFMEHPYVTAGWLRLEQRGGTERLRPRRGGSGRRPPPGLGFYYPHAASRDGGRATIRGVFTLSPGIVRRERLLTPALFPLPAWESTSTVDSRGGEALRALVAAARRGVWPARGWQRLLDVAADPRGSLGSLHHRLLRPRLGGAPPRTVRIRGFCEAHPRYAQRVTLVAARDRLGRRRTRVEWSPSPLELRSLARGFELLATGLRDSGIGRMEWSLDPDRVTFEGGCHHMGTTRMHADPSRGVVDADGRVHELANLFVSGSSVFPTAGFANPTLTIVALAIRLADHLKRLGARDA